MCLRSTKPRVSAAGDSLKAVRSSPVSSPGRSMFHRHTWILSCRMSLLVHRRAMFNPSRVLVSGRFVLQGKLNVHLAPDQAVIGPAFSSPSYSM
ncbi:hypothetical protein ACOMHN_043107 [Nucella lapillus]